MRLPVVMILSLLAFGFGAGAIADESRSVVVYKDPSCGCCTAWADALQQSGYAVEVHDHADLAALKQSMGVPEALQACHTARVDGYVIEGHVPIEAIEKLMSERPDIAGLAVPGMPMGSLGMGDDPNAEYDVLAISKSPDGPADVFYHAGPRP